MVTGVMLKLLEGFHHQADRRIVGKTDWCKTGGEWGWPPVVDALETARLCKIKEYIQHSQGTIP